MSFARSYILFTLLLSLCVGTAIAAEPQQGQSKAVIFAYSRIGDEPGLEDSLPLESFKSHIREIVRGGYHALPLSDIVSALQSGTPLPARSIALTFDAAGTDTIETVWPLLKENNLPFTIFIAPGAATDWKSLKHMAADPLVTIGLHPDQYLNMAPMAEEEARRHINNAKVILREKLGLEATLFAYPYGTLGDAAKKVVREGGFKAAFGQHSGAAHNGDDMMLLPRFTMSSDFGSLNRFILSASAMPLLVRDVQPESRVVAPGVDPLALGFTLDNSLIDEAEKLSCYSNNGEKPTVNSIGNGRIEIRISTLGAPSRLRVNCTLPAPEDPESGAERWRWLGFMFHVEHKAQGANSEHRE